MFENIVRKRDSYVEEMLKDILILGISQQEVKMMNNAEMTLWAKMVNLMLRSISNKIFLEDEFHLYGTQFEFMADSLFNGVAV